MCTQHWWLPGFEVLAWVPITLCSVDSVEPARSFCAASEPPKMTSLFWRRLFLDRLFVFILDTEYYELLPRPASIVNIPSAARELRNFAHCLLCGSWIGLFASSWTYFRVGIYFRPEIGPHISDHIASLYIFTHLYEQRNGNGRFPKTLEWMTNRAPAKVNIEDELWRSNQW